LLKALGAQDFLIQKIFLLHGLYIALTGIFWGLVLGLGICFAQQKWGFITLNEEAYLIAKAEVLINPWQVLMIIAITFLSCMITLLLPTLMIKKIKAIKAIRFS
jgi:lipoprotein-releasing system permease protein